MNRLHFWEKFVEKMRDQERTGKVTELITIQQTSLL